MSFSGSQSHKFLSGGMFFLSGAWLTWIYGTMSLPKVILFPVIQSFATSPDQNDV